MAKIKKKKSLIIVITLLIILIIVVLAVLIPKKLIKPKAGIGCPKDPTPESTSDCFCTQSGCYFNAEDGKTYRTSRSLLEDNDVAVNNTDNNPLTIRYEIDHYEDGSWRFTASLEEYGPSFSYPADNPVQNAPDLEREYGSSQNLQGDSGNTRFWSRVGSLFRGSSGQFSFTSPSPSPSPSARPSFREYLHQEGYSSDTVSLGTFINLWLKYNGLR